MSMLRLTESIKGRSDRTRRGARGAVRHSAARKMIAKFDFPRRGAPRLFERTFSCSH